MLRKNVYTALVLLPALCAPLEVWARIKLITLPLRERVEIQLDQVHATLIEEERYVPLLPGENQVDFAWANTSIDPDSIVFRVLEPTGDAVQVLSVSYPPNEQALVWQIGAKQAGAARVRISYVLHNLDKTFSYRALTASDEKTLQLSTDLSIENRANEQFNGAQIWAGIAQPLQTDLGINQNKKLRLANFSQVLLEKTYTADEQEYGYLNEAQKKLNIPMHYVLHNDAAHQLGQFALPDGKMRIFQQDSQGSSAFVGEDWGAFTPLDDKLKLFLGTAQDLVVKRTIAHSEQQRIAGNLFNHTVVIKYEVENFKTDSVTLDIVENLRHLRDQLRGYNEREVEWELLKETTLPAQPDKQLSSFDKLVFHVPLPPHLTGGEAKPQVFELALLFKNEWN